MDCSVANDWISGITELFKQMDSLLWFYPFVWGITMVSKMMSRG